MMEMVEGVNGMVKVCPDLEHRFQGLIDEGPGEGKMKKVMGKKQKRMQTDLHNPFLVLSSVTHACRKADKNEDKCSKLLTLY